MMTEVQFGETYPATTKAPSASAGKVVHSLFDATIYQGSPVFDRYIAAETEEAGEAALRDMPDATVVFAELDEGEEFFPLPPSGIFDNLSEPEDDGSEPRDLLGEGKKG